MRTADIAKPGASNRSWRLAMVGSRYGRLTVLGAVQGRGKWLARVLCDCGAEKNVQPHSLRAGATRSCGCIKREMLSARSSRPMPGRFWEKVVKTENCWVWSGSLGSGGYGHINAWAALGANRAHRVSWVLHHGPIPQGMHVLHRCDNPPCVRPDHLFLGTQLDNMQDEVAKGRHHHASKRRCKRGHPFTPCNTINITMKSGRVGRACRECKREYDRIRAKQRRLTVRQIKELNCDQ